MKIKRTWMVNGESRSVEFDPLSRLIDVLREELDLKSLKEGCGEGECGACSVILNQELQLGCLIAAGQVEEGDAILTAEGLTNHALGRALINAFDENGAVQCGYCSPGMLLAGVALLSSNPTPTEDDIRRTMAGHLCRCTGYGSISKAIKAVSPKDAVPREKDEC